MATHNLPLGAPRVHANGSNGSAEGVTSGTPGSGVLACFAHARSRAFVSPGLGIRTRRHCRFIAHADSRARRQKEERESGASF
jgi:hypothetical protein